MMAVQSMMNSGVGYVLKEVMVPVVNLDGSIVYHSQSVLVPEYIPVHPQRISSQLIPQPMLPFPAFHGSTQPVGYSMGVFPNPSPNMNASTNINPFLTPSTNNVDLKPPQHAFDRKRNQGAEAKEVVRPQNLTSSTDPEKSNDPDPMFVVRPQSIRCGEDKRTTIMVRNIPNKYSQRMLLDEMNGHRYHFSLPQFLLISSTNRSNIDFLYLPMNARRNCSIGYAFVNFLSPAEALNFYTEFHGRRWQGTVR
jgi:hypothetical protein